MTPTSDRRTELAAMAVGAAAGAAVGYYLATQPSVRRLVWQALKVTATTSLPAILMNELHGRADADVQGEAPSTVASRG